MSLVIMEASLHTDDGVAGYMSKHKVTLMTLYCKEGGREAKEKREGQKSRNGQGARTNFIIFSECMYFAVLRLSVMMQIYRHKMI